MIERWRAWLELRRRRADAANRCSWCEEPIRVRIPYGDDRYSATFCSSECQDTYELLVDWDRRRR